MNDKFDYFIERTEKDITELKDSQVKLHDKVDTLLQFKWQILGGAAFLATLFSIIISVFGLFLKH